MADRAPPRPTAPGRSAPIPSATAPPRPGFSRARSRSGGEPSIEVEDSSSLRRGQHRAPPTFLADDLTAADTRGWRGDPATIVVGDQGDAVLGFLTRLAAARPDWHDEAMCRGEGVEVFFIERGGRNRAQLAYELCGRCTVRELCLEYAIEHSIEHGVWGGMSPKARRAHRRAAEARARKREGGA